MSQRKFIYKWTLYSLAALLLCLFQAVVLTPLHIWGVHPFILPCIAAVAATGESKLHGVSFAFLFGFFCDLVLSEPFPCFYLLLFSVSALAAGDLARRVIMPGFLCSMAASGIAMFFHGILSMVAHASDTGFSFLPALSLMAREILVSVIPVFLIHFVYSGLRRYLSTV